LSKQVGDKGPTCGIVDTGKGQCGDTDAFENYICYREGMVPWDHHKGDSTCGAWDPESECVREGGNYMCFGKPV